MVAKLSRENAYRKGLEVFDALPAIGLMPDTAITNAAISACDKGAPCPCSLKGHQQHDHHMSVSVQKQRLDTSLLRALMMFSETNDGD